MRFLFAVLLLLTITGCTDSEDSVVSGGDFSVHFENKKDYDLAKEVVAFWKSDSLLTGKKQDVKLRRNKKGYDLLLISVNRKSNDDLSFEEIRSLSELHQRLQNQIFKDDSLSLVLTDASFKPLFRPTLLY